MILQTLGVIGWREMTILLFFALLAGVFVLLIRQNAADLQEITALLAEDKTDDPAPAPARERHGEDRGRRTLQ